MIKRSPEATDIFQDPLVKTKEWLKSISEELHFDNDNDAYVALRGVLHVLRDRLTLEEVVQLGAQLPMLIRGFYYEGWNPHKAAASRNRRAQDFLHEIEQNLNDYMEPLNVFRGVIIVLLKKIGPGEMEDIKNTLPKDIVKLWPQQEPAG